MITDVADLGDILRERRVSLGMTIEGVAGAMNLRPRVIEAIEKGRYDELPAAGYVRGYVSSYARHLGLDPAPLLEMYAAEAGSGAVQPLDIRPRGEVVRRGNQQHAVPWRASIIVIVLIALIGAGTWFSRSFRSAPEPITPPPTVATPSGTADASPSALATASATIDTATASSFATMTGGAFVLEVRIATETASWMLIKVDGATAYVGTLHSGAIKTFDVTQSAHLSIGRPKAVTVLMNGVAVPIKDGGNIGVVDLSATEPAN